MDEQISRRGVLAAAGAALSASVAGCTDDTGGFPANTGTADGSRPQPQTTTELSDTYRDVIGSVAAVQVEFQSGTGSGTAWMYDDDLLVTNEHVVGGADEVYLRFENAGWREATVLGQDRDSDLAVVSVENPPESATPLELADHQPAVGTPVAAIGNPFGRQGSFTTGVVSGRNRTVRLPERQFSISPTLQTDAALNPGNSGGPLLTYDGVVVGVVSSGQGEGIGFAIPSPWVSDVVPELVETGEYAHSYLGVLLGDVTPRVIENNDLPVTWGVYIDEVRGGTPADGVLDGSRVGSLDPATADPVGGDVIVEMDDWTIRNQEDLSAFLALETRPGDEIEIELIRDGRRQTVSLTVGERPD